MFTSQKQEEEMGGNDSRVKKHKGENGAKQCRKSKRGDFVCVFVSLFIFHRPQWEMGKEAESSC